MEEIRKEAIPLDGPILVDFYRDGCAPCRVVKNLLTGLEKELEDRIKMYTFNVDGDMDHASFLGVSSLPTLIIFRGEEELGRMSGGINAPRLLSWIEEIINKKETK